MMEDAGHMVTAWPDAAGTCPQDEFDAAIVSLPAGRRETALAGLRALTRDKAVRLPLLAVAAADEGDIADCDGRIGAPPTPELIAEALAAAIFLRRDLPTVDEDHMAELRRSLAPETLRGLLEIARRSIDDTVTRLEALRGGGDAAAIARAAHHLAGVAANFGCRALARLAEAIERNALEGPVPWEELTALAAATTTALQGQIPSLVDAG